MSNLTYAFNTWNINAAPEEGGVYALYDASGIIYIGRAAGGAVTIRSRLQSHMRGDEGHCTQRATAFWAEVSSTPITREVWLLTNFKNRNGRLPRCNGTTGSA